ncbi:MAG TPA: DUF4019 domain-containing protein [Usitatibacter sp.]|jgi:hypothetical protein|nr:DUF4019 domain-containing protein [Usitatibacter sp.]
MDRMRRITCVALLAAASGLAAAQEDELAAAPALAAAEIWLTLLDEGRYGQGWDRVAPMMQERISRTQWETGLATTRQPLGLVLRRKLRQANLTNIIAGAPDGDYFVLQYDTVFEGRPITTEVVTVMKDREGVWRVSGYELR